MEEYAVFLTRALEKRGDKSVLLYREAPIPAVLARFAGTRPAFEVFDHAHEIAQALPLYRVLRKYRPDIVHFHFYTPFSLLPLIAKAAGARGVIFTDHTRQPKQLNPLVRLAMRAWDRLVLAPLGVRILAVSEHIARVLVSNYEFAPERVRVLHNGINLERFVPLSGAERTAVRAEFSIPAQARVVVFAGWFIPEKGIDDLLHAAKTVVASRPEALFVIAGDGPQDAALKELAEALGIASHVRFTGLRSDIERLMGMSDIVAVPSVWQEAAALVNTEAMALERPVVATRVGGIPELVADKVTGRIVEPRAPAQLAAVILELLAAPGEMAALGRAGRARVESLFTMDRWIGDTLAIFDELLDR
jgi:glycosyltransferase involved in cell wall biosynthesis